MKRRYSVCQVLMLAAISVAIVVLQISSIGQVQGGTGKAKQRATGVAVNYPP
jgi:hypothetical protein